MFENLKNLGLGDLMKSAQQMQEQLKQFQSEIASRTVTADAGAGMVQATDNGRMELVMLKIDNSKLDVNDTEMLEVVVVAAVNAAQSRAAEFVQQEMQKKAGELGLPPGLLGS
jgi:DNA-binding YbaB/EbfC family protein